MNWNIKSEAWRVKDSQHRFITKVKDFTYYQWRLPSGKIFGVYAYTYTFGGAR